MFQCYVRLKERSLLEIFFQSQHEGCLGTPPTLEVNGYRMLPLCNVPTIKQTWPWQISFESPFTKRLNPTTCLQVQKHPSITWGKRFRLQTLCWSPNPQHLCVKSVRQPFFSCFLSISKEPISCSVGQGFEPQWAKNLLKPTLPQML